MSNGIADYFNVSQQDLLGSAAPNLPMANTMMPGYNEEMNIDDTGKIRFADYLKQFGDTAQGGLSDIADKGMSLFDGSKRSGLIRAGLGSVLFGFNPLTAILGAVIGQKGPGIYSALKGRNINPLDFIKEKRAERELAAMQAAAKAQGFQGDTRSDSESSFADTQTYGGGGTMDDLGADTFT